MPNLKDALAKSQALAEAPTLGNLHPDARAQAIARAGPEVTDAMVDAYLRANDAYWKRTDELPTPPNKWRTGTPREATRESLRAALGVPGTSNDQGEQR